MIDATGAGHTNLGVLMTSVMPTDPNQNMAVSLALASLAFIVTVLIGRPIVTLLRLKKAGKQIRKEGPASHIVKMGVPTMGGIMVSTTVVILTVVFNLAGRLSMLLPIGILVAFGHFGRAGRPPEFRGRRAAWNVRTAQDGLANRHRHGRRVAAVICPIPMGSDCIISTSPFSGATASGSFICRSQS